jgi:hypothetical protein
MSNIDKNIYKGFKILGKLPSLYSKFLHDDSYRSILLSDMLKMNYSFMRNYLTNEYINNLHVDSEFQGISFLNHYYGHFYSINYLGLQDKLYKIENVLSNQLYNKEEKYYFSIEEITDSFNFIFQCINNIEEQRYLISYENIDMVNSEYLKYLIIENDKINNHVFNTLDKKSIHIIQGIDTKKLPNLIDISTNSWISMSEIWQSLQSMYFENGKFLRYINWNPWKNYNKDHYSITIISGMEYSIRKLFKQLMKILHIAVRLTPEYYNNYVECLYKEFPEYENIINNKNSNDVELSITYSILYSIYMSKNLDNQKHQIINQWNKETCKDNVSNNISYYPFEMNLANF